MKRATTAHVAMDPRRCTACWKCIAECPGHAIGKVDFLGHRHAVFSKAGNCIGCNKCIKVCPNGAFFKPDEAAGPDREHPDISARMEGLQPWAFIASACTGIGLHVAGHGTDHEAWHLWNAAHIVTSLLWLACAGWHILRHRGWYRAFAAKGIGTSGRTTLVLSALFPLVAVTGIILLAYVDGPNSGMGSGHYMLGILLLAVVVVHAVRRNSSRRKPDKN